jgi:hypothetical protein
MDEAINVPTTLQTLALPVHFAIGQASSDRHPKFHLEMGQCLSLPESFHSWQSLSILRPASRRGLPSEDISQMKYHKALRMGADKASVSATVLGCE